jgi:sucrose-6-phosphate hydrolase SacC (GH32 family)
VWDALHLYIANNLDWMKLWIEQCEQHDGRLSWEGVDTLIKRAHRNEDHNLTQREIDLAYGLKDKQVSI